MTLVFPLVTASRVAQHDQLYATKPMTIRELIEQLEAIADQSTPVYLESGEPVHYTCHGMNQNETRFFIGVM